MSGLPSKRARAGSLAQLASSTGSSGWQPDLATGISRVWGNQGIPRAAQRWVAAPLDEPMATAGYWRCGYNRVSSSAISSKLMLASLIGGAASNHPLQIY